MNKNRRNVLSGMLLFLIAVILSLFGGLILRKVVRLTLSRLAFGANSPQYLKSRIYFDNPYIESKEITDWEKVNMLRDWASKQIPWEIGKDKIKQDLWQKDVAEIFYMFEQNKGGVDCSGSANILMKLYELYGYTAFEYHYGDLKGFNHVITLVKIPGDKRPILAIEDAYFNTAYANPSGSPIDIYDLLTAVNEGNKKGYKLLYDFRQTHLSVCSRREECEKPLILSPVFVIDSQNKKYYAKTWTILLQKNIKEILNVRLIHSFEKRSEEADAIMKKIKMFKT